MKQTTLCYLERGDEYLMLHRTKKENDENRDKWIGVGGHFEADESPEECLIREVKEETGYTLTEYVNRKRIDHAIFLLNSTDMQVQMLALLCVAGVAQVEDGTFAYGSLKKLIIAEETTVEEGAFENAREEVVIEYK